MNVDKGIFAYLTDWLKEPEKILLEYYSEKFTQAEFVGYVLKTASYLKKNGFSHSFIGIMLPNIPEAVFALYAASAVSGTANLINPRLPSATLERILLQTGTKVLFLYDKLYFRHAETLKKAGVKTARYCMATSLSTCKRFISKVGYPVIVKPDNGVGASDTHRISNVEELKAFFASKLPVSYIMEEYIDAEVNSYDAIIDSFGNPLFETGNVTPSSLMDVVNTGDSSLFYILNNPFPDVRDAGRRVVKAFGVKSRFVHFEFFRLNRDQHIGKKGEVVALEVNMRPSGGISPEMMNYANSTDVYKIWADMIAYDSTLKGAGERYFCAFVGRRDGKPYVHSDEEIKNKYSGCLKMCERVAKALSGAMGDMMFVANFKTRQELDEFYAYCIAVK